MELNPFAGAYLTDPADVWRELLTDPVGVQYAEDLGLWLIVKHEHVRRAFADTESFENSMTLAPIYEMCPEAIPAIMQLDVPPTTAAADPPVHPRTRRALRATFANTAGRVEERYGPIVRRRTEELVSAIAARPGATVDLVGEFAAVLPLLVVVDILGVPGDDVEQIKDWADGQVSLIWGCPDPDEQVRLAKRLLEFWRYCGVLVARRNAEGPVGDDFISRALRYRNGEDSVLTEAEVASMAFNLLVAGHETTAGLLAHALDRALSAPGRWRRIAEEPGYLPGFIEETLRVGPPIDGWLRTTRRPVTLDGVTIPAGARCLLLIGAANHDPAVFTGADAFRPGRPDGRDHLAFGYGPHFCIGAALARFEAQVALSRLAAALPNLQMAPGQLRGYLPNVAFRVHRALLATVRAGATSGLADLGPAETTHIPARAA